MDIVLVGIFGKVQQTVNVGIPVIEGREEEAVFRRLYEPVTDAVLNIVLFRIVTKSRFGKFNRTNTAQHEIIHII